MVSKINFHTEIIKELEQNISENIFDKSLLIKYKEVYEDALRNSKKLCSICKNLDVIDLPYDCLSKPNYCVKNENDFKIIALYEEIAEVIKFT